MRKIDKWSFILLSLGLLILYFVANSSPRYTLTEIKSIVKEGLPVGTSFSKVLEFVDEKGLSQGSIYYSDHGGTGF